MAKYFRKRTLETSVTAVVWAAARADLLRAVLLDDLGAGPHDFGVESSILGLYLGLPDHRSFALVT